MSHCGNNLPTDRKKEFTMGRYKKSDHERKKMVSIRLRDDDKAKIIQEYGSVSKFVEAKFWEEFIFTENAEEISHSNEVESEFEARLEDF